MQINILAVGRLKESYLTAAQAEYIKRITPHCRMAIIEVPDEKAPENLSPAATDQLLQKEAMKLEKHLVPGPGVYNIALAIKGKALSSEGFAGTLDQLKLAGHSRFNFIIGGSLGLHTRILNQCPLHLSFSHMTFPHQLMRVILLEQIYRAFKISAGAPYHK